MDLFQMLKHYAMTDTITSSFLLISIMEGINYLPKLENVVFTQCGLLFQHFIAKPLTVYDNWSEA